MIIEYQPQYSTEIANLFHRSVHALCESMYSLHQKQAWAPKPINYSFWHERLATTKPFLAIDHQKIIGFIESTCLEYIDCFYVDPDLQGKGIGSTLYQHVEHKALTYGIKQLSVDASLAAKPFFERKGFQIIRKNNVVKNNEILINFSLQKRLESLCLDESPGTL